MIKLRAILSAGTKTCVCGLLAIAIAISAIVLLVFSANSAVNGPFLELNIIKILKIDALKSEYEDAVDEFKEYIDEADDDVIEEFEKDTNLSVEEIEEILDEADDLSLSALKTLSAGLGEDDTVGKIFSYIITGIYVYAFVLGLLVLLALIFFRKGFFITAASLSALFFIILVGVVWFVVFLALCIAYSILVSVVRLSLFASKALS